MTPDLSKTLDPTGKDVFAIIIEEHKVVDNLAAEYFSTPDPHTRQSIAHNLVKLLSQHAACEEMTLYPLMKVKLPNGPQLVQHALAEHMEVKNLLLALDNAMVGQSGYDEKLQACIADVQQHVKEEEEDLLPSLKATLNQRELEELTVAYIQAKKIAPTRPHPEAPNEPPENRAINAQTVQLDLVRDAGRFSSA